MGGLSGTLCVISYNIPQTYMLQAFWLVAPQINDFVALFIPRRVIRRIETRFVTGIITSNLDTLGHNQSTQWFLARTWLCAPNFGCAWMAWDFGCYPVCWEGQSHGSFVITHCVHFISFKLLTGVGLLISSVILMIILRGDLRGHLKLIHLPNCSTPTTPTG